MDLTSLSRNDLIRLATGQDLKIKDLIERNRSTIWVSGTLVARLGGHVRITEAEMISALHTKRLISAKDPVTGDLIVDLLDKLEGQEEEGVETPEVTEDPICDTCMRPLRQCNGHEAGQAW